MRKNSILILLLIIFLNTKSALAIIEYIPVVNTVSRNEARQIEEIIKGEGGTNIIFTASEKGTKINFGLQETDIPKTGLFMEKCPNTAFFTISLTGEISDLIYINSYCRAQHLIYPSKCVPRWWNETRKKIRSVVK